MKLNNSILKDVRVAAGLSEDSTDFDTELLMHINTSIVILNQNGVGRPIMIEDDSSTWADLMDITQIKGNEAFSMVPLFISLKTKIIFDPPPPSTVAYYESSINQMLWRLKIAYENPHDSLVELKGVIDGE